MIRVLLLFLMSFTTSFAQEVYVRTYNLVITETDQVVRTDSVCIRTDVLETFPGRDQIIFDAVVAEVPDMHFVILRTIRGAGGNDLTYAVEVGKPDQLYAIKRINRPKHDEWYISIRPIRINNRIKRRVEGRVIEMSNQNICQ